jgi:hypothetical protein
MKLCPMCEKWRVSSYTQKAIAICGKCFALVDNERATITVRNLQVKETYKK